MPTCIIKHNKGQAFARYVFNLRERINDCDVKEILPCLYTGEKFEGYDKVCLPYHRLRQVFRGEIMPTYYEALKKGLCSIGRTKTKSGRAETDKPN